MITYGVDNSGILYRPTNQGINKGKTKGKQERNVEKMDADVLDSLIAVLQERKSNPSEKSYTSSLFQKGDEKICEKISEEAGELVEAATEQGEGATQHLVHEAADLLFHTMVLLVNKGLTLEDVRQELSRRFGMSGLEEKANRPQSE